MLELSPDQQVALDRILSWAKTAHSGSADLTLGGLAGTGKTTILHHVVKTLGRARVMAPTGRAAQVLRRKGVPCETIHSVVYDYNGTYIDQRGEEQISWRDKEDVPLPALWICDEASMVSTEIHRTVKQHEVPVLWVGDHGQLAPIGGDPGLMRHPDIVLEKIHRQAAGSPILSIAHAARAGGAPVIGRSDAVSVVSKGSMQAMVTHWIDEGFQVACGRNATRRSINLMWRVVRGHQARLVPGERLICLFNDRFRGVFNGTMMTILSIAGETEHGWAVEVEDDGGARRELNLWNQALGGGEWHSEDKPNDHIVVDYAYAITVHKSQGGEWDRFAVVDEAAHAWDHARWRYTAFTRARQRLLLHL